MKKRIIYIILSLVLIISISGCVRDENDIDAETKPIITTTLFPQYDFSKIIVGDKFDVIMLLPPGVEAHSFELTPKDMSTITNSDLFIYTGDTMEPWVNNIMDTLVEANVNVLDLSEGIKLKKFEFEGHEHHEEGEEPEEHEDLEYDPHYWTDPMNAKVMVDEILKAVVSIDKANEQYYTKNAEELKESLDKLDEEINQVVNNSESKTIISGGHFAFGYFADRYGLEYTSPYEGFSPNAEPSAQAIANLVKIVEETGAKAIFYEELVDPKIAKIISEQTGIEMLELHAAHNVSREELESEVHYIDIMNKNLENLKKGLGYNE
ncbi:zinc ABC transporter substrate-binding protein [Soehngenia longivitae]|uniref:Zinc ABC transporter substrate-binding protein n=1 Tax=Soehngenia longivitae TaxID=2562294 RepID=A0A4Z0D8I4_9FIRM|nr:metal ABC transporter substrate-binding protein [Soehngenia longivitae]TFZ41196.1 zinc ABC transporter substrate-binding protein [Soehngenia longivitae]